MRRILCTILLMVTAVSHEGGIGSVTRAQDNCIKLIKPVVKQSGWKIPGLEQSKITDARKRLPKGYGPVSVPLYLTVYKPKRNFITTISLYGLKSDQTITVSDRKVLIDGIIKCDLDGRVFMFIVRCTIILEEPNGRTGYSGQFGLHYFDDDGDGKFESFEGGAPFVTPDLRIPEWVLR